MGLKIFKINFYLILNLFRWIKDQESAQNAPYEAVHQNDNSSAKPTIEGYLFKRSHQKVLIFRIYTNFTIKIAANF